MYTEKVQDDGNAFGNFAFDVTGGSAKSTYYLASSDAQYLQSAVTSVLGYTETNVSGQPTLNRTLPKRHPKFPYLFASRITSLVGVGMSYPGSTAQDPSPPPLPALDGPSISNYLQYNQYEMSVEFTGPRTYPMVANGIINSTNGSWTRPNNTTQNYTWAPEFLRYTDFDFFPQDNTIQGQQGEMSIYRSGSATPFTSPPWMWLPDQILKITWYQVPYRFILSTNSYIAAAPWRGRVNQNYLWLWPPGYLLYLGYSVKKYAPPTGFGQTLQNSLGAYTYFNYAQLCDIELNFLITNRRTQSIGGDPGNLNYVTAGHNLLPDLVGNTFWYGTRNDSSGTAAITNPPAWLSAPLECLFRDPDSSGGPDLV